MIESLYHGLVQNSGYLSINIFENPATSRKKEKKRDI